MPFTPDMRNLRCAMIVGILVAAGASACGSSDVPASGGSDTSEPDAATSRSPFGCPEDSVLTYENFGAPFMLSYCTGCHSSALDGADARRNAPQGVDFDDLDGVLEHVTAISGRATGDRPTMPPGGGPPEVERQLLAEWLACGAPEGGGVAPFDTAAAPMTPSPEAGALEGRACAQSLGPLGDAALPRCTAETYACVLECEMAGESDVSACKEECQRADPTPPGSEGVSCNDCVFRQGLACARETRCRDTVASAICCLYDDCLATGETDCIMSTCAKEFQAMLLCIGYVSPHCFDIRSNPDVVACFEQ